jgi:hypothetical protein
MSVGSRIVGGKAARSVAGSQPNESVNGLRGSTCRGKALRAGESVLIDEGTVEAVLGSSRATRFPGAARRDRERQRPSASLARGREHHRQVAPPRGWCAAPESRPNKGRAGPVRGQVEAGNAPSSAWPAGAGSSRGGPAPPGRTRPRSGRNPAACVAATLRSRKSSDSWVLVS